MAPSIPQQSSITDRQLHELKILYQFSNTMLSTIRLNKLAHLILSILTFESNQVAERAMLFLRNEKSGVLQGMLGVTRQMAASLELLNSDNILSSRWDISDEGLALQREEEFCRSVRTTRIAAQENCAVIRQVIINRQIFSSHSSTCDNCPSCKILEALGVSSFSVVPLLSRDKPIGVIIVDNPLSNRQIDEDNLNFLRLVANQAGMAVENSMLYNRIEEAHTNLRDAKERLIHGERLAAIGEMAANLAHELKNPLITIGGFSSRLVRSLPANSKEGHYADTIVKEVCRLERMLADILAFSRKPTICYSNCEISDIVDDCIDNCQATLEDNGIEVSVSIADTDEMVVLGDAHQLKQALLNLMLNACDVMPDGGRISICAGKSPLDNNAVIVSIQDTGGGIPKEMLPRIFNPFFTTKQHGTGLGLAIVNRILTNHGGSITAGNENEGAVFTVSLPKAQKIAE